MLQLNVEAYPSSSRAYNSLADAYAADGNKNMAIANYEKALALDPKSPHPTEALKKLKEQDRLRNDC